MSSVYWQVGELAVSNKMNQTTLYIGSTAPATLTDGKLWWDTTEGCLRIYDNATSTWRRPQLYVLATDDTLVTNTGTTEKEKKYFRFIKSSMMKYKNLHVEATLWTSNASGTATLNCYIDAEGTPRLTKTTTSTTETVVSGDFSITNLTDGLHTMRIKLDNSGSYTTSHQYIQFAAWGC